MNTGPADQGPQSGERAPGEVRVLRKGTPFAPGFVPNGRRNPQRGGYITKRGLLRIMLEQDLTVKDLPEHLADRIREVAPGFLDHVKRKFTMYQIMELVQLQLLFSKSDYVRQDAINAIKDRVEGKPTQKLQLERPPEEETAEMVLPNGQKIYI